MSVPLLSVVVPVYNAEKYLSNMVDSILDQDFEDFELFLINDGSTDKSLEICNNYLNIDKRVVVIDKKNEGPSATRNLGIEKSNGKYLLFLDSDDIIENNMFKNMIEAAEKNDCDLVICGFYADVISKGEVLSSFGVSEKGVIIKNNISIKEYAVSTMMRNSIFYAMCNKLYRLDIIKKHNIRLRDDVDMGEDLLFNLEYTYYSQTLQILGKCYYHYFQYDTGKNLMSKYRDNKHDIMRIWYDKILWFTNDVDSKEIIDYVNWLEFRWVFSCFIAIMSSGKNRLEKLNYISEVLRKSILKCATNSKYIGRKKFILEKILSSRKVHLIYLVSLIACLYKSRLKLIYLKNNINSK